MPLSPLVWAPFPLPRLSFSLIKITFSANWTARPLTPLTPLPLKLSSSSTKLSLSLITTTFSLKWTTGPLAWTPLPL